MERQPRLSRVQRVGQLTNAPLAFAEQLDDLESGLVGECVEELDRSLRPIVGSYGHNSNISRKVVMSIPTQYYPLPAVRLLLQTSGPFSPAFEESQLVVARYARVTSRRIERAATSDQRVAGS